MDRITIAKQIEGTRLPHQIHIKQNKLSTKAIHYHPNTTDPIKSLANTSVAIKAKKSPPNNLSVQWHLLHLAFASGCLSFQWYLPCSSKQIHQSRQSAPSLHAGFVSIRRYLSCSKWSKANITMHIGVCKCISTPVWLIILKRGQY